MNSKDNEIKIMDQSCREFSKNLADKVPVPGGGGACALVGALASSLCSMSANFTTGKKKYAEYEEDIKNIIKENDRLRVRLLELVEEDAKAFEPLSKVYSLPKDYPNRQEKLDKATIDAAMPPLNMVKEITKVIDLLELELKIGSKLMVSDVGCGAYLAKAALEGAALNVFVNTRFLSDKEKALQLNKKVLDILDEFSDKAEKIGDTVRKELI